MNLLSPALVTFVRVFVGARALWVGSRPLPVQRIYFANHSSHLDTVVLWSVMPPALRRRTHAVAARDYWGTGVRRLLAHYGFNAVLIDRHRADATTDPLAPLDAALDAGDSLILFPEGTRNPDPTPKPFKSGLYHLATRHPTVELIPVHLDNPRRALPKGAMVPLPLVCTATFGAPMQLGVDEPKEAFLERCRVAASGAT